MQIEGKLIYKYYKDFGWTITYTFIDKTFNWYYLFQFILIRKLFIEGCAPKPIEENIDNDSEDNDNSVEYKSNKKKKKGKLYQIVCVLRREPIHIQ